MQKIVFIEDEVSLQQALSHVLKEEGYEVVSAYDGETGLAMVHNEKPDLVLLDLILPKLHGFTVLEKLKSDPATAKIPVIILSNLEDNQDVERALTSGASAYLVKTSYQISEVVQKIKEAIAEVKN